MKPNLHWQLLLALACLGLIVSLFSFQAQTAGGLCVVSVPAPGGNLVEGIVGAPVHLNPLLSDTNPVDKELASLIFDGLLLYDSEGRLQPNLASSWEISEDGLAVTFTLRDDIYWHDGEPITAEDVLFSYGLLQDEEFPIPDGLRALWQSIQITSDDPLHVTFTMPEPNASFLEMTTRGIIPAHILEDVPVGELAEHDFNRFPVGSGPWMVNQRANWPNTGSLQLSPNPSYWSQGMQVSGLEYRFFHDNDALMAAYRAGEIQAINTIPPSLLQDYLQLPGLRLFTAPAARYSQLLFNLTESGSPAVSTAETRRALALGLNRRQLVDEVLQGQGLPLEGPYLPSSWAYDPALLPALNYDAATAVSLLESAGWTLPAGSTVRQNNGEPLELDLLFWDVPPYREIAEKAASDWAELGVRVSMQPENLSGFREALAGRDFDVALADVTPPGDPDLYDFWSQEAVVRGQNFAGWNNRRASEALEQARRVWSDEERLPLYQAFLGYYNSDLPALTLFQYVYNYGLSDTVHEAEIGLIENPRERYQTLSSWFLLFRDVLVGCPEGASS